MRDKKLLLIATEFRTGMLDGAASDRYCFMVCAPLQGYLRAVCGFETELIEGEPDPKTGCRNHFWLRLRDGRVLDPTIDQFKKFMGKRLPKVYLGEPIPQLHRPI